jgi:molecular chaperone GrpE
MTDHVPYDDTLPADLPDPDQPSTNASPDSAAPVDTPAGAPADAPASLMSDDARAMDPLEAQRERYLRLAAEYDNYRKRTSKEIMQASVRGQGDLVRSMLDSLDDLSRFAHVDPTTVDAATVVEGAALVEKNLFKALANIGVEVIDPVEMPFDPNLHEAISTVAAETPDEDHMVAQVYQRGYLLKGQLLRPARVVVKQYQ